MPRKRALLLLMAIFIFGNAGCLLAPGYATLMIARVVTAAFATVPGLQLYVLHQAAAAPNLASTLNIGAFNIGNALGAWLGGTALAHGAPLDRLPWLAALMTLGAIGVTLVALRIDRFEAAGRHRVRRAGADVL